MNPHTVSATAAISASGGPAARSSPNAVPCAWCGGAFTPRSTGGHTQRFCCPTCRRDFDAAGRRWVAEAIACGLLSLAQIRKGAAATRALLSGGISPPQIREDEKPSPASSESSEEAAELLDDLLVTLLADLPDAWCDLADALPDELLNRLDYYVDILLSDGA